MGSGFSEKKADIEPARGLFAWFRDCLNAAYQVTLLQGLGFREKRNCELLLKGFRFGVQEINKGPK